MEWIVIAIEYNYYNEINFKNCESISKYVPCPCLTQYFAILFSGYFFRGLYRLYLGLLLVVLKPRKYNTTKFHKNFAKFKMKFSLCSKSMKSKNHAFFSALSNLKKAYSKSQENWCLRRSQVVSSTAGGKLPPLGNILFE